MKQSGAIVAGIVVAAAMMAGCGEGTSNQPDQPANEPDPAVVKVNRHGQPVEPRLTEPQKRQIYRLAREDPQLQEILDGRDPEFVRAGYWTGQNGELLGAVIDIRFRNPGNYVMAEWPRIVNQVEIYGIVEDEGSRVVQPPKPGARPRIGTTHVTASEVEKISVLFDLRQKRTAEIVTIDGGPSALIG